MQTQQPDKATGLPLMSNITPGQLLDRNIVVATSPSPEAASALAWAVQNVCRDGDAVHLVHVVRCLSTPTQVYPHGPDGAPPIDERLHHEREDVLQALALINAKLLPLLESDPRLFYDVHSYVDTWNASPEAVGTTILRLATELRAAAVVLATNDQPEWDPMRLGSVSKWVLSQSQGIPIALFRKAKLSSTTR